VLSINFAHLGKPDFDRTAGGLSLILSLFLSAYHSRG
jgi:hypothetical protein